MDVGDGGIVEIFPPDKRGKLPQELLAGRDVAGSDARLDQRRALPVLAEALVIGQSGVGRERDCVAPGSGRSRRSVRKT